MYVGPMIDSGEIPTRLSSDLTPREVAWLALFPCVEHPIYATDNISKLGTVPVRETKYIVLDGKRDSPPLPPGGQCWTGWQQQVVRQVGPVGGRPQGFERGRSHRDSTRTDSRPIFHADPQLGEMFH